MVAVTNSENGLDLLPLYLHCPGQQQPISQVGTKFQDLLVREARFSHYPHDVIGSQGSHFLITQGHDFKPGFPGAETRHTKATTTRRTQCQMRQEQCGNYVTFCPLASD
jgi:hypothetical protein